MHGCSPRILRTGVALCLLLGAGSAAGATLPARYLSIESGFNRGDFGTGLETTLYTVRATVGLIAPDYDANISLPLHRLEGDGGLSASGVGDISVQVGRTLLRSGDTASSGTVYAKLPTADEDEGLGTGEVDYGATLSVERAWNRTRASVRVGYLAMGDAAGAEYGDIALYGFSVFRGVGAGGVFVSLAGRRSTADDLDDPIELRGGAIRSINARIAVSGDLLVGVSDGSADVGANIGVWCWLE